MEALEQKLLSPKWLLCRTSILILGIFCLSDYQNKVLFSFHRKIKKTQHKVYIKEIWNSKFYNYLVSQKKSISIAKYSLRTQQNYI